MYSYFLKWELKGLLLDIKNNLKKEISEDVSIALNVSQKGC